jgi:hypothetical protein
VGKVKYFVNIISKINYIRAYSGKFFKRLAVLACLLLVAQSSRAQLVNIESRRMHNDTLRYGGNALLSMAYQDNDQVKVFSMKSALALQVKSKDFKNSYMFLGNSDWTTVNRNDVVNSAFAHIRYNRKITEIIYWEAFTQWQHNKLLSVGRRWLTGTGPRIKFLNQPRVHAYVGSLYMYEHEVVTGNFPERNRHHRSSSYITVNITLPQTRAEIISTAYFQPRLAAFADYRVTWQTALTFQLTKRFRWTSSFNYLYDAFPPEGIAARAISFDQGFRIEF